LQFIFIYSYRDRPIFKSAFILPSGSSASVHLHVLRAIARKAERIIWKLIEYLNYEISKPIAVYLNRLSDLFFVLVRYENRSYEERLWKPKTYYFSF